MWIGLEEQNSLICELMTALLACRYWLGPLFWTCPHESNGCKSWRVVCGVWNVEDIIWKVLLMDRRVPPFRTAWVAMWFNSIINNITAFKVHSILYLFVMFVLFFLSLCFSYLFTYFFDFWGSYFINLRWLQILGSYIDPLTDQQLLDLL